MQDLFWKWTFSFFVLQRYILRLYFFLRIFFAKLFSFYLLLSYFEKKVFLPLKIASLHSICCFGQYPHQWLQPIHNPPFKMSSQWCPGLLVILFLFLLFSFLNPCFRHLVQTWQQSEEKQQCWSVKWSTSETKRWGRFCSWYWGLFVVDVDVDVNVDIIVSVNWQYCWLESPIYQC